MEKSELKQHLEKIRIFHKQFSSIDKGAECNSSDIDTLMVIASRFAAYVEKSPDLYKYILSKCGSGTIDIFNWNEIISIKYFKREIGNLIEEMNRTVNQ